MCARSMYKYLRAVLGVNSILVNTGWGAGPLNNHIVGKKTNLSPGVCDIIICIVRKLFHTYETFHIVYV